MTDQIPPGWRATADKDGQTETAGMIDNGISQLHARIATLEAEKERLVEVVREARQQIEYLHGKFQATGSGNTVLARIDAALNELGAE